MIILFNYICQCNSVHFYHPSAFIRECTARYWYGNSVRLPVTPQYYVKTAKHIVEFLSRPTALSYFKWPNLCTDGATPAGPQIQERYENREIFCPCVVVSQKRWEIVIELQWSVVVSYQNRMSCIKPRGQQWSWLISQGHSIYLTKSTNIYCIIGFNHLRTNGTIRQ